MITNGEQEIDKVLCILPDGSGGAPCGACRELMVQLMPNGKYKDIEIMLDYAAGRTVKTGRHHTGMVDRLRTQRIETENGTRFPFWKPCPICHFQQKVFTVPLLLFSVPLPADPDMRSDGCRT